MDRVTTIYLMLFEKWASLSEGLNGSLKTCEHTDTYTNMCTHNATLLPFKATYSLLIISNGGRQRWQNKLKVQQGNLKNVETISDVGMLGLWPLCKKTESPIRRTECLWHKNYILVKIHGCTSTHSPPHTVCGFTQDSHAHLSSQ